MVKKIIKVVGIICKLYIKIDILYWAWIGLSNLCAAQYRHPEAGPMRLNNVVVNTAKLRYRNWKHWYDNH